MRRFETTPEEQAQVDWEHVGDVEIDGQLRRLRILTFTVAYSRIMMAEVASVQKLDTLLRLHEEAFRPLGGVTRTILNGQMTTVWQGTDQRGEMVWNLVFLYFARH